MFSSRLRGVLVVCCIIAFSESASAQFLQTASNNKRAGNVESRVEPMSFEERSSWHIGFTAGPHFTFTRFSNIDNSIFNEPSSQCSYVCGLWLKKDFAKHFSLRPEFLFLERKTLMNVNPEVLPDGFSAEYFIKAGYFDFRLPFIFEFNRRWLACPYVYLAPVMGIAYGGDMGFRMSYEGESANNSIALGKSNFNPLYFAGVVGAGVTFNIKNLVNLGAEISYEYGFTDTYSKSEKEGSAITSQSALYPSYKVDGHRRFSGLEVKFAVSVPFSTFKKRKRTVREQPVSTVYSQPVIPTVTVKKEEESKPCYSLEEVIVAINNGKDASGMTICATKSILFQNNKSTISRSSYEYLDKVVLLLNNTSYKMEISGHTDSVGDDESNMRLSEKRAESVYKYLIAKGISPERLTYKYYGESCPIATNDTEEGRSLNRRVEFTIK